MLIFSSSIFENIKDGRKYIGEWVEGKRTGFGKCFYTSGDYYEGQIVNDKKHGAGKS